MEMLLTGDMVGANDAQRLGLVNRVVADETLEEATLALARQIASKSPLTLAIGKEAFYRQAEMDLAAAYAYASEVMTRNMMARDAEIGIDALLTRTTPQWCGR
jgi:enoyl-CoA hydratase/carnithine racemase